MDKNYVAFENSLLIAQGSEIEVALKIKERLMNGINSLVLVFDKESGKQVDLNLSGTMADVQKRYTPQLSETDDDKLPKVGRPKLGVISKEVSLLPHHWEWLTSGPKSASATLRRLVEDAIKRNREIDAIRLSQEATTRFMSAVAGDFILYEEALRALYSREEATFKACLSSWPKDIREQIIKFSAKTFNR